MFAQFVSIVDTLAGDHLPESIVNDFIASDDFAIYQQVAGFASTTDEETRATYYHMVDDQLGNMSPNPFLLLLSRMTLQSTKQLANGTRMSEQHGTIGQSSSLWRRGTQTEGKSRTQGKSRLPKPKR